MRYHSVNTGATSLHMWQHDSLNLLKIMKLAEMISSDIVVFASANPGHGSLDHKSCMIIPNATILAGALALP